MNWELIGPAILGALIMLLIVCIAALVAVRSALVGLWRAARGFDDFSARSRNGRVSVDGVFRIDGRQESFVKKIRQAVTSALEDDPAFHSVTNVTNNMIPTPRIPHDTIPAPPVRASSVPPAEIEIPGEQKMLITWKALGAIAFGVCVIAGYAVAMWMSAR